MRHAFRAFWREVWRDRHRLKIRADERQHERGDRHRASDGLRQAGVMRDQYQRPRPYQPPPSSNTIKTMTSNVVISISDLLISDTFAPLQSLKTLGVSPSFPTGLEDPAR